MKAISVLAMAAMWALGCSGAASEPAGQATQGSGELALGESVDFCVELHEQMASCAGEFIDMNFELRARSFPPFAEQIADPAARAEMRKVGIEETIADGTGPVEARRDRCRQYVEHGPKVLRGDVEEGKACFQKASCAEKIACLRPSQERRYEARAKDDPKKSTPAGAPNMN